MTPIPRATATIAHVLKGIDFPCDRQSMVDYARRQGAGEGALEVLRGIPDQAYGSMAEVFRGVGHWAKPDGPPAPEQAATPEQPAAPEQPSPKQADAPAQAGAAPGRALPPEPADFEEDLRNAPPFALGAPEGCRECLMPWLWPLEMTAAALEFWQRSAVAFWRSWR